MLRGTTSTLVHALEPKPHAGLLRHLELLFWFSLPKTISDIAKQLYEHSDEEKLLRRKELDTVTVIVVCIFIEVRNLAVRMKDVNH